MTAPCQRTDKPGIVDCSCPTYDGPYHVRQSEVSCDLGDDHVWSAAYAVDGPTFPTPPSCVPDAPGSLGCPLYESGQTVLPPGTDCAAICEAYACAPNGTIEPGYTCDSTLCTSQCNDLSLVIDACGAAVPEDGTRRSSRSSQQPAALLPSSSAAARCTNQRESPS
jgi:hypothetical protein